MTGIAAPAKAEAAAAAAGSRFRRWIVDAALPVWSTAGFDAARGQFQERLDWRGQPLPMVPRRAMVQSRQIYVFAHAALLGWFPAGAPLAEAAMASLLKQFCDGGDASRGFAFSVGPDGDVTSAVRDAYTHAFILFALAALYRLNGDARLLACADKTFAFIDACLADGVNGGVFDAAPVVERGKRQNPHMHLLEACIALDAAAPGRGYIERAAKLIGLFKTRLFRADPGILPEYFAEDWGPSPDLARRDIFEPGHHFEWIWLLRQYQKRTGDDLGRWIAPLDRIARSHGIAANGLIVDEVGSGWRVAKASHRLWPHTEAIKAAVAKREIGGGGDEAGFAAAMAAALATNFLDSPFAGGWTDQISAAGRPLVDYVPASSLYHLFLAAAEMARAFER